MRQAAIPIVEDAVLFAETLSGKIKTLCCAVSGITGRGSEAIDVGPGIDRSLYRRISRLN